MDDGVLRQRNKINTRGHTHAHITTRSFVAGCALHKVKYEHSIVCTDSFSFSIHMYCCTEWVIYNRLSLTIRFTMFARKYQNIGKLFEMCARRVCATCEKLMHNWRICAGEFVFFFIRRWRNSSNANQNVVLPRASSIRFRLGSFISTKTRSTHFLHFLSAFQIVFCVAVASRGALRLARKLFLTPFYTRR